MDFSTCPFFPFINVKTDEDNKEPRDLHFYTAVSIDSIAWNLFDRSRWQFLVIRNYTSPSVKAFRGALRYRPVRRESPVHTGSLLALLERQYTFWRAHDRSNFLEIVKISTHMLFVNRCWFPELELSADLPTPSDDRVLFTSDCHPLDGHGIDKISCGTAAPPLHRYLDYPRTVRIVPLVFPILTFS